MYLAMHLIVSLNTDLFVPTHVFTAPLLQI